MRIIMPLVTLALIITSIVLSTITKKKDYSKKKKILLLLISIACIPIAMLFLILSQQI